MTDALTVTHCRSEAVFRRKQRYHLNVWRFSQNTIAASKVLIDSCRVRQQAHSFYHE